MILTMKTLLVAFAIYLAGFAGIAAQERNVILVITGGAWCDPCTQLEQNTLSNPRLTREIAQDWTIVRVSDVDPAAEQWNISRLPTVLLLGPDGSLLDRATGPITVETLVARIEGVSSRTDPARPDDREADAVVYRLGEGRLWNEGGARWFTEGLGLPAELREYDRDEIFLYLRAEGGGTLLAVSVGENVQPRLWRWSAERGTWNEVGALQRVELR
jgi:hypothetical protein